MDSAEAVPRVAVFLIVVLGLGVLPALPAIPQDGPAQAGFQSQSYEVFEPGRILATPPAGAGDVQIETQTREKLILIDVDHNNRFGDADIEPLVTALERRGHEVRYFDTNTAKPGGLAVAFQEADAFVVINPRQRYEVSEADAVEKFVQDGGRVLLVGRPTAESRGPFGFRTTGVRNGHAGLAGRFDISFGSGALYNMRDNQNNFRSIYASPRVDNEVTTGVDQVVFRDATPVQVRRGTILLRAEPGTHLTTTRDRGQYPVMVRTRNIVAVGDGTFLFPENTGVADNAALVGNIAEFLVTGDHVVEDEEDKEDEETGLNETATDGTDESDEDSEAPTTEPADGEEDRAAIRAAPRSSPAITTEL